MGNTKKALILAVIAVALFSFTSVLSGVAPALGSKEVSPNSSLSYDEDKAHSEELAVWEALQKFNWMADDGVSGDSFADKPFLMRNAVGNNGAVGILDVDLDGKMEFIMAAYHFPRGVPSIEVFALRDNELESIGGFFEGGDDMRKLSYYRDNQGRLLFLQETQSHYGGIYRTLVATYVIDLSSVPIASSYSYYYDDSRFPNQYFAFPRGMKPECTNAFLRGEVSNYKDKYDVTEEEYSKSISEFMDTLTWVKDVAYNYTAYYHLYNSHELPVEIRGYEISEGLKASPPKDFRTPEEIKRTSDMVASLLYEDYLS